MTAARLRAVPVERVWGRRDIPAAFPRLGDDVPVGEIWFEPPAGAALLVKYLFTSERLSVQVHPDNAAAAARGLPRGKDEAWYIIDAEPDARIGLGLTSEVSRDALRDAALDGSIEQLLDWRPVSKGDILYSPAGTIHAIGSGISLIEIQQNLDVTYRLYDYDRPRELHLEEGIAVATLGPWIRPLTAGTGPDGALQVHGPAFMVEHRTVAEDIRRPAVVIPIRSVGTIDGAPLIAGEVWDVPVFAAIAGERVDLLIAYPA